MPVGNDRVVTFDCEQEDRQASARCRYFRDCLDMAPDAMEEMVTKVTPVPAGEPGNYSFKARFSMEGRWQLSLGAKVQGETGTVDNKLVITATR